MRKRSVRVCVTAGIVLSVVALGLYRSPRIALTVPSGPWGVGTALFQFDAGIPARTAVIARLWYPAPPLTAGRHASYLYGVLGASLRDRLVTAVVSSQSIIDAPVAVGRFPLVVYIPGAGGQLVNNSSLAQELASHGFVVAAIDDTRASISIDFSSNEAIRRTKVHGERKVRLQAHDVLQLVDALQAAEAEPTGRFAGRIDLQRVGVVGFSFGGAVAAQAASMDSRIRGAVDLDGSVFGDAAAGGISKPFMLMIGAHETEDTFEAAFDRENIAAAIHGMERHGGYVITVADTEHYNFSDAAVLPTVRKTGLGSIDGRRGERIVAHYVLAFFNRWLRGEQQKSLDSRESFDRNVTSRSYGSLSSK